MADERAMQYASDLKTAALTLRQLSAHFEPITGASEESGELRATLSDYALALENWATALETGWWSMKVREAH